jgi:hypothetical protein
MRTARTLADQALIILDDMADPEVAAQARRAVKLGSYEWKADAESVALCYVGSREAVVIVYPNGAGLGKADFEVDEAWLDRHLHEWEPLDVGAGTTKCRCGRIMDPFFGIQPERG